MLAYYKIERAALIGKNYLDVSRSPDKEKLAATFRKVIRTGAPAVFEEVLSENPAGVQYNKVKAFKVRDGLGITASNITKLKNSLESLEVYAYKLSHDIKSPINSILGLSNIILNGQKDPETLMQYCLLIQQQANRIDSNLTELLSLMRSEHTGPHFEEINFYTLIENVKRSVLFNDGFKEIQIEEKIDLQKKFFSSRIILDSLFQNLIENAIKYRDKEKSVKTIKITVGEENEQVKILIEDNGMGIPDDQHEHIFKVFFRATESATGTGLGLYTVKYSIEKLNGSIQFESKQKQGTLFRILLPFQRS